MTAPANPPAAGVDPAEAVKIHLAEYGAIKDEQQKRIDRRDHLVYGTLTAAAATVAALVAAAAKYPQVLLLLPPVTLILGWTHLVNDQKISAAGRYLRDDLGPRLAALAGQPVLGWESAHRGDRRRRQRKCVQLAVDIVTFAGPAVCALGAYLTLGHPPVLGWLAALGLAAATAAFTGQQVAYAASVRRPRGGQR